MLPKKTTHKKNIYLDHAAATPMDPEIAKSMSSCLNINFYNPNHSKLHLKNAEGDAWLDGKMLGHFTMDTLIHIPANSNFSIPVKLEVDMHKVLKNAMQLLINPEVLVKIDGKARVGKAGFYFNYPLKYLGKQNLAEILQ